jgi:hypothetical protein
MDGKIDRVVLDDILKKRQKSVKINVNSKE